MDFEFLAAALKAGFILFFIIAFAMGLATPSCVSCLNKYQIKIERKNP